MPTLYYPLLFLVPVLWIAVIWIHGLVKTESLTIGSWARFFRNIALGTLMVTFFLWAVGMTSPLLINWSLVSLKMVNAIMDFLWLWIVWSLIANFVTGGVNHIIVRVYSIRRWGTASPKYGEWEEFDAHARRSNSHTTIWFNNSSWSPVTRSQASSLASRSSVRASRSSSRPRSVSRSSPSFFVLPTRSTPRAKSPSRSSGGGRKGGSGGGEGLAKAGAGCLTLLAGLLKAIIAFLIQALIILGFIAATVFFAWLAYRLTIGMSDWFDEIYVVDVYAEEV